MYGLRTGRQRREQLGRNHFLLADVLRIDQRSRSGHRDRLCKCTDLHVGVDGRRKPRGQCDPVSLERVEARQTEGHHVRAGAQADDVEAPLAVRHDGADLFDQGRTGGFHRHARQHPARRISDHSGDAARLLRPRSR